MKQDKQEKINELLNRGVEEIIGKENLEKELLSGKKLRVKLGIDPTSPNIHLGRSIPLLKLRDFQNLGHTAVLIVGDFTGLIGDTSDKDSERPMLSTKQVKENLKTYKKQLAKIIDIDKAEFHFNSQWLKKLNFSQIGELASIFSINQFISRELIAKRIKEGKRVSLHETLYPLMQGYDSVAIKADIELGASDQKFNILAGRDIQKHFGQKEQYPFIVGPIIEGLDGRKMSSSWGNTINFNDEPFDMFGKIMSMRDELILKYFDLLTRIPLQDFARMKDMVRDNPKQAKILLAKEIVTMYHGAQQAQQAEQVWRSTFEKKEIPENTPVAKVKIKIPLAEVLLQHGLISSKNEWKRLVQAGAIKLFTQVHEEKIIDPETLVSQSGDLKIGKKKFLKIIIEKKKD